MSATAQPRLHAFAGRQQLHASCTLLLQIVKAAGRINNAGYQKLTRAIRKTASRDLEDLRRKRVFKKIGKTGRGTYYVLASKGDIKGT